MGRRDEEKKKRRLKRLARKEAGSSRLPEPIRAIEDLIATLDVKPPAYWPGAADPSLERPDLVKLEMAEFVSRTEPGRSKLKRLERAFENGLLSYLPDMDHWAMEQFFWHGVPGDDWHPIDAFLESAGLRFPIPAREQLRRWKEAKLGIFEIGQVRDETVELRRWDPIASAPAGPSSRAITLNIGGVNSSRDALGKLILTYVAPWAPEAGLSCGLGYGLSLPKESASGLIPFLGLNAPDVVGRALPWQASPATAREYQRLWKAREWHSWFEEHLQFPFQAVVPTSPESMEFGTVERLMPSTPEQARQLGVYLEFPGKKAVLIAGATSINVVDVTSANALAIAEYRAYRSFAGPPPGTADRPTFYRVK